MDVLEKSVKAFKNVECKIYNLKLDNNYHFRVKIIPSNLPHLLGLHKLKDIEILKDLSEKKVAASLIYKKLTNLDLDYSIISKSVYFSKIEDKLKWFYLIEDLLYNEKIVIFNKKKLKVNDGEEGTLIKSNMIFYLVKQKLYIHLCLAKASNYYYPETFLVHHGNYYVKKQVRRKITDRKITKFEHGKNLKTVAFEEVAATRT